MKSNTHTSAIQSFHTTEEPHAAFYPAVMQRTIAVKEEKQEWRRGWKTRGSVWCERSEAPRHHLICGLCFAHTETRCRNLKRIFKCGLWTTRAEKPTALNRHVSVFPLSASQLPLAGETCRASILVPGAGVPWIPRRHLVSVIRAAAVVGERHYGSCDGRSLRGSQEASLETQLLVSMRPERRQVPSLR